MSYKPTIGLEIHAELNTASKMFCSCKNNPEEELPNTNICEVCTAQPGALPVANEEAVKKVIKAGLALNCEVSQHSKFDRKNYFYPDLPKGYQISQYDMPLCSNGFLEINLNEAQSSKSKTQNERKKIRITRIHLEEDTGSLIHPEGTDYSLINLNRAGVPLMELVTEPDISSGKEAGKFAKELQLILKYLDISEADMEKGLMRVEVNISLSKTKKLGTKVEIKNLNSFKVVEKAIDYEIKRQKELLENGEKVIQETRGWNDKKGITFSQREKEEAHDYRYFPEPDLPEMNFDKEFIEEIKKSITEKPSEKRERFKKEYSLEEETIEVFLYNKDLSEYFEKVISELHVWLDKEEEKKDKKVIKLAANYLTSDLIGILGGKPFIETDCKITPENFAELVKMIYKNEISSKAAKMVLVDMFNTGSDPSSLVKEKGLSQISDELELNKVIEKVIKNNKKAVDDYKKGNKNVVQFLAGQVMKETKGAANPETTRELLEKTLS